MMVMFMMVVVIIRGITVSGAFKLAPARHHSDGSMNAAVCSMWAAATACKHGMKTRVTCSGLRELA